MFSIEAQSAPLNHGSRRCSGAGKTKIDQQPVDPDYLPRAFCHSGIIAASTAQQISELVKGTSGTRRTIVLLLPGIVTRVLAIDVAAIGRA